MDQLRVDCYCGHRGEETPRRFWILSRCVEVKEVIDCWLAPHHRYFKTLGSDGDIYILKHDPYRDVWELTFFKKTESEG